MQCLTCSCVSAAMVATASACGVTGVLAMCSLVVLGAWDVGGNTPGARVAGVTSVVVLTSASSVGVASVGAIATARVDDAAANSSTILL